MTERGFPVKARSEAVAGQAGWSLLELLIALVVLGLGVTVFMRMQHRSSGLSRANSNLQRASQLIEKHVESLRVHIARDASAWPPKDTAYTDPDFANLQLKRVVSAAVSPKDGASLATVRRIDLTVWWGSRGLDTMKVTTYVSKSF
jgi:prepilin-type N-terminal cleavage/methylation domain-containing protein